MSGSRYVPTLARAREIIMCALPTIDDYAPFRKLFLALVTTDDYVTTTPNPS